MMRKLSIGRYLFSSIFALSLIVATGVAGCKPDPQEQNSSETESIKLSETAAYLARMLKVFTKNAKGIDRLYENISNAERIDVIKNIPVSEILSAPGHLNLRNPKAVVEMAKAIEAAHDGGQAFIRGKEKIVLNVFVKSVVSEDGKTKKLAIKSIEVMDGNHRLAAGLLARMGEAQDHLAAGLHAKRTGRSVWATVGDIPADALEIRVNGSLPLSGQTPPRWIPEKIFQDASCTGPCAELRSGRLGEFRYVQDDRGGRAAQVPGSLSSLDNTIPQKYRGKMMIDVLRSSLQSVSQ